MSCHHTAKEKSRAVKAKQKKYLGNPSEIFRAKKKKKKSTDCRSCKRSTGEGAQAPQLFLTQLLPSSAVGQEHIAKALKSCRQTERHTDRQAAGPPAGK